mmetsp:Transcript_55166/g.162162  ORF Transcript_55166/g.162162 Transcript_55166/m.162162 type:complete len:362 (-) Transcript_55166:54-1139(-)
MFVMLSRQACGSQDWRRLLVEDAARWQRKQDTALCPKALGSRVAVASDPAVAIGAAVATVLAAPVLLHLRPVVDRVVQVDLAVEGCLAALVLVLAAPVLPLPGPGCLPLVVVRVAVVLGRHRGAAPAPVSAAPVPLDLRPVLPHVRHVPVAVVGEDGGRGGAAPARVLAAPGLLAVGPGRRPHVELHVAVVLGHGGRRGGWRLAAVPVHLAAVGPQSRAPRVDAADLALVQGRRSGRRRGGGRRRRGDGDRHRRRSGRRDEDVLRRRRRRAGGQEHGQQEDRQQGGKDAHDEGAPVATAELDGLEVTRPFADVLVGRLLDVAASVHTTVGHDLALGLAGATEAIGTAVRHWEDCGKDRRRK